MKKKNNKKKRRGAKSQRLDLFVMAFIVKLGFALLSTEEKINRARRVVNSMAGNLYFPTPLPALATVATAINALEAAQKKIPGGPAATEIRNLRERELDVLMSNLRAYVESESQGNPDMVLSSGMELRNPKRPIGILPAPEWLIVKQAPDTGSAKLKWKANRRSRGYRIEVTTDPAQGWPLVFTSEKASILIPGLTPGTKYYFRVATLSRAGYEGFSPVAKLRMNLAQD